MMLMPLTHATIRHALHLHLVDACMAILSRGNSPCQPETVGCHFRHGRCLIQCTKSAMQPPYSHSWCLD